MHTLVRCLAVTALLLNGTAALANQADGTRDPLGPPALTQGFLRTVFGLEYGGGHADAHKVKRFAGEVRFFIEDGSGRGRAIAAARLVDQLPERIRGLRSRRVATKQAANFHLTIVRQADYARVVRRMLRADALAMGAHCIVGVTSRAGRIVEATAVVPGDDAARFTRCLIEEVLQGLGPMNDDDSLAPSVFNDTSPHTYFTAFDQALLNILYHPKIRPGMTRSQARRVLPYVIRDLGY